MTALAMLLLLPVLLVTLVGHIALCVIFINRIHATAFPYWFIKCVDALWYLCFFGFAGALTWFWLKQPLPAEPNFGPALWAYSIVCWIAAVVACFAWLRRLHPHHQTMLLASNHSTRVNLVKQLGYRPTGKLKSTLLSLVPGNQILQVEVNEKELHIPRLHPDLDGLSLVHISDLHLTGQLLPDFYKEIVRRAVDMDGDVIAITGDIIDKRHCLPWIEEILGPLKGRHGTFFVLGNHDVRAGDVASFRRQLTDVGLTDLGAGRWLLLEINGQQIIVAGNELPWFAPSANAEHWPLESQGGRPLRLLLSHTPDQIQWAQHADVDLMVAGHTHGGQIRLPFIGPSFSPSRFGGEYASGTFYCEPTVMHVSRGLAGTRPIRINCPPEVTKLILRPGYPS